MNPRSTAVTLIAAGLCAVTMAGCGLTDPKMNPPTSASGQPTIADVDTAAPTGEELTFSEAAQLPFMQGIHREYVDAISGSTEVKVVTPLKDGGAETRIAAYAEEWSRESITRGDEGVVILVSLENNSQCIRDITATAPDTSEADLKAEWQCTTYNPLENLVVTNYVVRSAPMNILEALAENAPATISGTNNPLTLTIALTKENGESNGSLSYTISDDMVTVADTMPDGRTANMTVTPLVGFTPPNWDDLNKTTIPSEADTAPPTVAPAQ